MNKKIKIAFVNITHSVFALPPLGIAYISSYLKNNNKDLEIKYFEGTKKGIKDKILTFKPDIAAFLVMSPYFFPSRELANELAQKGICVVLGGHHITALPESLPISSCVGVIGEGEITFSELISLFRKDGKFEKEKLMHIKGLAYYDNNKLVYTQKRSLIENLDSLPKADRTIFDYDSIIKNKCVDWHYDLRTAHIITSRGCPYRCVFCIHSKKSDKYRQHSARYIMDEILYLRKKLNVNGIACTDDLFVVDKNRIKELIRLLREHDLLGKIKFQVSCRANMVTEELAILLKEMGVVTISIGIESGSDKVLKYLNKGTTVAMNQNAIDLLKKYGFNIYSSFMLGIPTETKEDMLKTLQFIKKNKCLSSPAIYVAHPLPSTTLWDYCINEKIIKKWEDVEWNNIMKEDIPLEETMYINKEVPKEEFIKIYKEIQAICLRRVVIHPKYIFSFETIKKAFLRPILTFQVLKKILMR